MTNGETQQAPQPAAPAPAAPEAQAPAQPAAPAPGAPAPEAAPAAAPAAAPGEAVPMGTVVQWAAAGGVIAGAIQAVLGIVSGGFDPMGMAMTIGMAVVFGVLSAVLLGQFGAKIPVQGPLMIKAALFMFVISLVAGFAVGGLMSGGFMGMLIGIIGIGAGSFAYGWLIQQKVPNLI